MRPTEAVLLDLADAFAAMPDGAEKSALAVKLFGKSGVELIPFLNQGRAGIEELKQKFKELGLEIRGDTARAAEKFNDTLDTVKQALQGIAMRIAEGALPAMQRLADALVALAACLCASPKPFRAASAIAADSLIWPMAVAAA